MPIVNSNDLNEFRPHSNHSTYYKKKNKNYFSNKNVGQINRLIKTNSDNDHMEFTSTEGFDYSQPTTNQNNSNHTNQMKGSFNCLFNKSTKHFNTPKGNQVFNMNNINNVNNINMPSYKKSSFPVKVNNNMPFNSSNLFTNNNINYSNQSFKPVLGRHGQHSFSIEPWNYNYYLKDNINNRSISQINNKNLSNLMSVQSEELYIVENVDKLLKDQNGCRILQKKLDEKNSEFIYVFYERVKDKISDIINNQFGNYLIQKFVECCISTSIHLLENFIDKIKSALLSHSNDPYGSRVIQKTVEMLTNRTISQVKETYKNSQSKEEKKLNNNINDLKENLIESLNRKESKDTVKENTKEHLEVETINRKKSNVVEIVELKDDNPLELVSSNSNQNININNTVLNSEKIPNQNSNNNIVLNPIVVSSPINYPNKLNKMNSVNTNYYSSLNNNNPFSNTCSNKKASVKDTISNQNNNYKLNTFNITPDLNANNSMHLFDNNYNKPHNSAFNMVNTSHQGHYSLMNNNYYNNLQNSYMANNNFMGMNMNFFNNINNVNIPVKPAISISNSETNTTNITNQYDKKVKKLAETLTDFARQNIFSLIVDTNGNHVLQKIYILSIKNNLTSLHDDLIKQVVEISKLKQGASIIQKIIDNGNDNVRVRKEYIYMYCIYLYDLFN